MTKEKKTVKWLFDKIKTKNNYYDLTSDQIRTIRTFGDVY